jgi:glycosyltransferase involved in cell wall biosynthesis
LNIGLVIYGSLETVTGGFIYDRNLVEHLRARGDHVEIFSLPWRNYGRHLMDNFSSYAVAPLAKASIDILIQDELNHPSLFLSNRRLKREASFPIVSIVHHLRCREARARWQNQLYAKVERQYLSLVDGFIFVSQTTRGDVETLCGSGKPFVVAHPGRGSSGPTMTRETIENRAREQGPLRILFVGSLIPRKELHTLLAALARIPEDRWRLEVVGSPTADGTYGDEINVQIGRFATKDQVRLLGTLTREGLVQCYSRSHILAVPSSYEGFGIVYLEGMGFGLPSIAGSVGAASEIVTQERDGFLVNPGDSEAIARHVTDLISDRDKLIRMSMAALDRYDAHPTWAESAAKATEFLDKMVGA